MSDTTISPNMSLIVPTVGQDPGPDWANNLNADLGILDQHDHSSGSGVPVNTNGININADLPIHGNNLTSVKTVNFQAQLSALPGLFPNLGCVYVAGNELYYNDEAGNVVQITNTGSVNAGAGSITGLPSGTASASYNSGSQTFVWQSATLTPANMDGGSFIFRDISASSKGVTVSAPVALAADYQMFWPSALPGATAFLTLDNSGGIASGPAVTGGITSSNIAAATILGSNIAPNTVAPSNMAAANFQTSSSCGSYVINNGSGLTDITNLTVTITTFGRPVILGLIGNATGSYMYTVASSNLLQTSNIHIQRAGSDIAINQFICGGVTGSTGMAYGYFFPGTIHFDPIAAGTHTYKLQAETTGTFLAVNLSLFAYEI